MGKNLDNLKADLEAYIDENGLEGIHQVREFLSNLTPFENMPVDFVQWVDLEKVRANDYNPNQVADEEMRLLYISIDHDGYTQPIVTVYDEEKDEYVIVDGFHRFYVGKTTDIKERTRGKLPVVVIDKDINDRMASTVRHNRARGKHTVTGMSNLVFEMLDEGWGDEHICNELGMEPEELLRLKHITGFSKLFENTEYARAWKARNQILEEKEYREEAGETDTDLP